MSSPPRSNSPLPAAAQAASSSSGSVTPPSPTSASRKEMLSIEEKERRLAEERAIAALRLQRKQRLDALVRKRKTNLRYLQVSCVVFDMFPIFSLSFITELYFSPHRKLMKVVPSG